MKYTCWNEVEGTDVINATHQQLQSEKISTINIMQTSEYTSMYCVKLK